ncbi:MAG: hypothetical protein ACXWTY_09580 [Methylobacter sp.]
MQRKDDCACCGGQTRTKSEGTGDREQCVVCENSVAWDLLDNEFFGFTKPCQHALKLTE